MMFSTLAMLAARSSAHPSLVTHLLMEFSEMPRKPLISLAVKPFLMNSVFAFSFCGCCFAIRQSCASEWRLAKTFADIRGNCPQCPQTHLQRVFQHLIFALQTQRTVADTKKILVQDQS